MDKYLKRIDKLQKRVDQGKTIAFHEALWINWAESRLRTDQFLPIEKIAKETRNL